MVKKGVEKNHRLFLNVIIGPDDCLFDAQGMCFWKDESPSSGYRWTRIKGRTPSSSTGPDNDHTTDKSTKDGIVI